VAKELFEAFDDQLVVNDFVVAVHRRIKTSNHPRKSLNCHFDACAKAAWSGE
jgi:hypothetical protein